MDERSAHERASLVRLFAAFLELSAGEGGGTIREVEVRIYNVAVIVTGKNGVVVTLRPAGRDVVITARSVRFFHVINNVGEDFSDQAIRSVREAIQSGS